MEKDVAGEIVTTYRSFQDVDGKRRFALEYQMYPEKQREQIFFSLMPKSSDGMEPSPVDVAL